MPIIQLIKRYRWAYTCRHNAGLEKKLKAYMIIIHSVTLICVGLHHINSTFKHALSSLNQLNQPIFHHILYIHTIVIIYSQYTLCL